VFRVDFKKANGMTESTSGCEFPLHLRSVMSIGQSLLSCALFSCWHIACDIIHSRRRQMEVCSTVF